SGQMEQVLMNLSVNARDAMPNGGRLLIETSIEQLTEEFAREHLNIKPGTYLRLLVSDTGVGMSKEIRERLFEPFFTTKEPGKGTGLGLSTVYGIVRNSGGHIWVYSEVGHGTTLKIYLPLVDAPASTDEATGPAADRGGSETVLLVEDEESVRTLVRLILEEAGYQVHAAATPAEAIALCEAHRDAIQLLLSDVVMPKMGGRELAERVRVMIPSVKVVFMSGYTEDTAFGEGKFPAGARFIQKPVLPDVLRDQVRQAIDA
ncbi:MAG TPA: ATP-binding protein, partial [bacterium]